MAEMDVLRLVVEDVVEIREDLRAAMGERYPEFELRLEALLRELRQDPSRFPPQAVRALIDEYLAPEVAQRIVGRTLTLAGDAGGRGPSAEYDHKAEPEHAPGYEPGPELTHAPGYGPELKHASEPGAEPEPTTGSIPLGAHILEGPRREPPGPIWPPPPLTGPEDEPAQPAHAEPDYDRAVQHAPPPLRGRRGWHLPELSWRRSHPRDRVRPEIPDGPRLESPGAQTTYVTVPVWYATDRLHQPWAPPARRYGADMSIIDDRTVMNYGTVDVSIPKTHRIGRLESPKWYLLEWQADPERHVVVQGVTELDEQAWLRSIRKRVGPGPDAGLATTDTSRDILIFIHGYRTSWAESARRAAQFAYDLDFQGLPMLYSWPSRGDLLSYTADESASAWSAPHFTAELKRMLAESGARRVHLVAHSMGNRVSTEALKVLALERPDYPTPVREVVFAAPDIDRHTFQEFVTAFNAAVADFEAPRMPRLTLYACGVDSALDLSRRVHRLNRAGDSRKGIVVALPMDTIEVARKVIRTESRDSIGHSYFCSNSVVIADLVGVVLEGRTPMERAGLAPKATHGGPYWRLVGARGGSSPG